jgi:hypothetical protein
MSLSEENEYLRYGILANRSRSLSSLRKRKLESRPISSIPEDVRSNFLENIQMPLKEGEGNFDSPSERTILDVLGMCSTHKNTHYIVPQRDSFTEDDDMGNSAILLIQSNHYIDKNIDGASSNQILFNA